MPVVLRFGELDLVRGDWRRYVRTLDPNINPDRELDQTELNNFEVGVISIEQNEGSYVLPPGIDREKSTRKHNGAAAKRTIGYLECFEPRDRQN